jgi:hypothetical protein
LFSSPNFPIIPYSFSFSPSYMSFLLFLLPLMKLWIKLHSCIPVATVPSTKPPPFKALAVVPDIHVFNQESSPIAYEYTGCPFYHVFQHGSICIARCLRFLPSMLMSRAFRDDEYGCNLLFRNVGTYQSTQSYTSFRFNLYL